ncbi:MAG TPA: hypothetical protein VK501_21230 [Baekduia sp.]|uniref:hypothetical protein n=1 Tax=Baekduia sp. TaxID=2600305 RepID=UPI002D08E704|nr:hypothetical protein [Baekduia sp.]HMJ36440.1 hypothetical protein [Baekduia sp.]
MRVTFLGREIEHRPWVLGAPAGDVVPTFVPHPDGASADALLAAVRATDPEVVVALSPRDVPGEALAETGALTLAVVDEEHVAPGVQDVWDVGAAPLPQAPALPEGYDRVLTTDPLLARAVAPPSRLRPCLRGRARMELFRASAIWPRVLADLAADVAAYGRGATAAAAAAAGRP